MSKHNNGRKTRRAVAMTKEQILGQNYYYNGRVTAGVNGEESIEKVIYDDL